MATPTRAELETQLQNLVDIWEETRKFAEDNADNFVLLENTAKQSLESDFVTEISAGIDTARANLNAMLVGAADALTFHLRDWGRFLGTASTDVQEILDEMYDDFIDNNERLNSRNITFGSPAIATGTGSGTIQRLTADEQSQPIENVTVPDSFTARVISDANSGTDKGKEIFEFLGGDAAKDAVESLGSGLIATISSSHPDDALLLNPSFDSFTLNASNFITDITSWEVFSAGGLTTPNGLGTDFAIDSGNSYLPAPDDATSVFSLEVKLPRTLRQKLNLRRTALDPENPYYAQVAWNRQIGTGTGTIVLHMGTQSASVSAVAQTGWQVLQVPASLGSGNWVRNFTEDDLAIRLSANVASGSLHFDDTFFHPMTNFDGTWYIITPGVTPFEENSTFTWSDTLVGSDAILQRWLFRVFGRFLPSSTTPTVADPT